MIDATVSQFFTKNAESDYERQYEISHGPRLSDLVERLNLGSLKGARVLDVGGGLGFLGKRLDQSNDYWVVDGAKVTDSQKLCSGTWRERDLDHEAWGYEIAGAAGDQFDICFALEVLEHIGNPHFAIEQIKTATKMGGVIIISIPTETVWHNVPYCGLLWPPSSFAQFLDQMALPVRRYFTYEPKTVGWPAHTFICENRPYREKVLRYPKEESKFLDATPLQCTNL